MKKRWLSLGLALLIGTSVAVSDMGTMQAGATQTSNTTENNTTQNGGSTGNSGTGAGSQSSNTGTTYSTANNARFTVDGNELVVTENLNPAKYPKDFTETQVECKGKKYKGLKFDKADIQMICLLNQKTGVAAYHIYRDSDESVYPFIRIESGNDYIIAMPPFMMEEAQVPSGYNQTELEFEKGKAQVYQAGDNADSYLIYAMNSEGNKDWYEYNAQDKTYQTYQTEEETQEGETGLDNAQDQTQETSAEISTDQDQYQELEEKYDKEKSRYRIIIAVLVVIIVVLLMLLFNKKLLKKRDDGEDDEDFYDNDGDFYDDYEEEMKEVLSQNTAEEEKIESTQGREEEVFEEEDRRRIPRFLKPGRREREVDELLEEEFFDEEYEDVKEEPEPVVRKTVREPEAVPVAKKASPVKKEEKYESDIEILDLNDL